MPLPEGNPDWPPESCRAAQRGYDVAGAWYAGDPERLSRVYGGTVGFSAESLAPGPVYGGARAGLAPRMFWGAMPPTGALQVAKLHVPLAGDIASTSSDLLFGEPPALVVPDVDNPAKDPTQQRLDRLWREGGMHAVLLEAGEVCAAYGGVYLRAGWDRGVADTVLFDAIPPDAAVPEFRSGRLTAVTFHRELRAVEAGRTYRHLERHEPGRIWHGLYASTDPSRLGVRLDLRAHPETAAFGELVNRPGWVATGAKGLAVEYVPNMRPNRALRGSPLGRSDYAGVEGLLDALDEAWTSWLRDLRIGKGRVIIPDVYMQSLGRGKGAVWDAEQEIFTQVNALPGGDNLAMQVVQFEIRVAEHQATCAALTAQAVRGSGYSVQTFGEGGDVAATATEVHARERRSFTTRARKIEYWRAALARISETALAIDLAQFHPKGVKVLRPDVEWPDGVAPDPEATARTIQMLDAAKAVSTRTKVVLLHPDWDDERVAKEVEEIDKAGLPPVPPPGEMAAVRAEGVPDDESEGVPTEPPPPVRGRVRANAPPRRRPGLPAGR